MAAGYFLRGLVIGLIFGIPAGAIGALTIQRTIKKGFVAGLITGAGSSAADLIYSCVGVFGLTVISDFLIANQSAVQIIGGILILLYGAAIFLKREQPGVKQESKGTLVFYFLSAFSAAILNPATIVSFMVAFTAFGINGRLSGTQGFSLIVGILVGTLCWWSALSYLVTHIRKKITGKIYIWLNYLLGGGMVLFGLAMIINAH